MFGLKINPAQAFGMLKNMGIDLESYMPRVEGELMNFFRDLEKEAQSPLMMVANPDEGRQHFTLSLYRVGDNGNLSLYRSFPFSDIIKMITNQNISQNEFPTLKPAPEPIATGTPSGTDTEPGTGTPADPGIGDGEPERLHK